jgi:mannose-6-phosphate isomerase-like protein (cupin superfamily)
MKMVLTLIAALAASVPAVTLTGDKALVISANEVQAQLVQYAPVAAEKGSSGGTMATYGNLSVGLSVRTISGGGEVHQHFDDLMIVQQGSATLVTGGSLVDPKTGANGEIKGSSVQNGVSRKIIVGDVVIVPAGVPHQLLIPPGTTYSAMVAKIKEP